MWDFICILEKGVEEPQENTLCLPSQKQREELAGIHTQFQPCTTRQLGETWNCFLPLCQAWIYLPRLGSCTGTGMGHPSLWP